MNKRIDYKRNPRYNHNNPTITFKSLMGRSGEMGATEEKDNNYKEEKENNINNREAKNNRICRSDT